MTNKYDDIINLPHHVSKTRPQMPIIDRAAQFSPFAALTGHGAAVEETARLTDRRIELDEQEKNILSNKLQFILERISEQHEIAITYFKPDEKKDGGFYITAVGVVKKIDEYERLIIMTEGIVIPIDEMIRIDGSIFETIGNEQQ